MIQEVTNFSRFYTLLNQLPCGEDRESMKREIVSNYTWGRTESVREMSKAEYEACCQGLEHLTGVDAKREKQREELRHRRSICLKQMQGLGIDTTDWARINNFCRHPRICGVEFGKLSTEELKALSVKLRSIKRKGGLKEKDTDSKSEASNKSSGYLLIDITNIKGKA